MDLVTVTCFEDFTQTLIQAESIQKFVEPCTHWIVVNEIRPELKYWKSSLAPYYTNHKLKLVSFSTHKYFSEYMRSGGYYSQQVFKLLVSKFIKSKYLVIDAKHIFKTPLNLNDYEDQRGNGTILDYSKVDAPNLNSLTIETYANKLGVPFSTRQLNCLCPFVIDAELLKQVDDLDDLLVWFSNIANNLVPGNVSNQIHVNEYLLYSTIFQKYRSLEEQSLNKRIKSIHIWENELFSTIDSQQFDEFPLIGFHRRWVNTCPDNELKLANDWLNRFNFKNKLTRTKK